MTSTPPHRTILVIDDEAGLTRLIKLSLEATGRFTVVVENDATTATATAERIKPDLILLDVMMPGADGGQIAEQLQARSATRTIPIVFLTAAVQEREVSERGGKIGGFPFIAKPVGKEELIAVIEANVRK